MVGAHKPLAVTVVHALGWMALAGFTACGSGSSSVGELKVTFEGFSDAQSSEVDFSIRIETIEATQVFVPYTVEVVVDGRAISSAQVLLGVEGLPSDPSEGYLNTVGYMEINGNRVSRARGSRFVLVGHRGSIDMEAHGDGVEPVSSAKRGAGPRQGEAGAASRSRRRGATHPSRASCPSSTPSSPPPTRGCSSGAVGSEVEVARLTSSTGL